MEKTENNKLSKFMKFIFAIGIIFIALGIFGGVKAFLQLDFMQGIVSFFNSKVVSPYYENLEAWFGNRYPWFIAGDITLVLFIVFAISSEKVKQTSSRFLDILACASMALVCIFFENIGDFSYPMWYALGAELFIALAYVSYKKLYLVSGIYFLALTCGVVSGFENGTCYLGISKPVIQIFIALAIIMIGFITEIRTPKENELKKSFSTTYYHFGLLLLFVGLWIASIWGFQFALHAYTPYITELLFANVLSIGLCALSMFIGLKKERPMFFNYGFVFLLINVLSVYISVFNKIFPSFLFSLILGAILIGITKVVRKVYLKG